MYISNKMRDVWKGITKIHANFTKIRLCKIQSIFSLSQVSIKFRGFADLNPTPTLSYYQRKMEQSRKKIGNSAFFRSFLLKIFTIHYFPFILFRRCFVEIEIHFVHQLWIGGAYVSCPETLGLFRKHYRTSEIWSRWNGKCFYHGESRTCSLP